MKISAFPNMFKKHAKSTPGHTLKDTSLLLCGHQIGNKIQTRSREGEKCSRKVCSCCFWSWRCSQWWDLALPVRPRWVASNHRTPARRSMLQLLRLRAATIWAATSNRPALPAQCTSMGSSARNWIWLSKLPLAKPYHNQTTRSRRDKPSGFLLSSQRLRFVATSQVSLTAIFYRVRDRLLHRQRASRSRCGGKRRFVQLGAYRGSMAIILHAVHHWEWSRESTSQKFDRAQ